MTKDEALKLAREAGLWPAVTDNFSKELVALAELVAAAEFAKREWNFCERCGKRTADLTTIHTCTPPQEALYGMNQDDWKDVVAAISKVRDGRGVYLACRPTDVFKDWFLALGTAKVKEKK
jgi:hypothetical protein